MATSNYTTYCVYRIVCFATGRVYIGKSNTPKERKHEHFNALRNGNHHSVKLQRAYNKYGADVFYFEILESGISDTEAFEREVYWVQYFDSYRNGFNCTPGGNLVAPVTRPCFWNGVQYPSIRAAATAAGMSEKTLSYRLRIGHTCNDDMPSILGKPVIFDGIQYPNMRAAAEAVGITTGAMSYRLKNGGNSSDRYVKYKNRTGKRKSC